MKIKNNINIGNCVTLHDNIWLEKQRIAGKVAAKSLIIIKDIINNYKNESTLEINNIVESFIYDNKCVPTFKNYKNTNGKVAFPASVCISVNNIVVHGIPNEYILQDGDVVSFDLGVTYEGAIADTAVTYIVGNPKSKNHIVLLEKCNEALYAGINAIRVGNRLGCIGNAINNVAKKTDFKSITQYGGHGLDYNKAHSDPFISNIGNVNEGIRLYEGMTLAIEPQFVDGPNTDTYVTSDNWSVKSSGISCHFEHTVFLHKDHVEIITDRNL